MSKSFPYVTQTPASRLTSDWILVNLNIDFDEIRVLHTHKKKIRNDDIILYTNISTWHTMIYKKQCMGNKKIRRLIQFYKQFY